MALSEPTCLGWISNSLFDGTGLICDDLFHLVWVRTSDGRMVSVSDTTHIAFMGSAAVPGPDVVTLGQSEAVLILD